MPLTGDLRRLRGWAMHVASLGKPSGAPQRSIAKAVGDEVRGLLTHEFSTGVSPTGAAWQLTKRGKPALLSKKLPLDFKTSSVAAGVFTSSRIPWLRAHHEGHVFPARAQTVTQSKKGRFLSAKRQRRMKLVFDVRARVGRRVLPARPIYPDGPAMPAPWAAALNRGIESGMLKWRASAQM